eukprot:gene4710-18570_t
MSESPMSDTEMRETFETSVEKTRIILDFLLSEAKSCLVVVGAGGTGKTHSLNAALGALPDDLELNVYVWNDGELQSVRRFSHVGASSKWVVFRHEYDSLARELVREWSCQAGPSAKRDDNTIVKYIE